jgi:hypothetical protein
MGFGCTVSISIWITRTSSETLIAGVSSSVLARGCSCPPVSPINTTPRSTPDPLRFVLAVWSGSFGLMEISDMSITCCGSFRSATPMKTIAGSHFTLRLPAYRPARCLAVCLIKAGINNARAVWVLQLGRSGYFYRRLRFRMYLFETPY